MKNDYLFTVIHNSVNEFILDNDATYLYGKSLEERSHFVDQITERNLPQINFIRLVGPEDEKVFIDGTDDVIYLRSASSIKGILTKNNPVNLYIDATGLDNRICAALIKNAIELYRDGLISKVKVIYAEPGSYDIKAFKTESVFNNLSEKIDGISPLPGFASIFPQDDDDFLLVALIGFEGGRFSHMLESVQPTKGKIIPVLGVPGFRPEYPYAAYWGNRRPLEETETWRKIKFASANSMVEVYMMLSKLLRKNPSSKIKVAPIGTKPHAIAAMLFAIKNPRQVELVYDNPKRKKGRTEGIGHIIECHISKLIEENG